MSAKEKKGTKKSSSSKKSRRERCVIEEIPKTCEVSKQEDSDSDSFSEEDVKYKEQQGEKETDDSGIDVDPESDWVRDQPKARTDHPATVPASLITPCLLYVPMTWPTSRTLSLSVSNRLAWRHFNKNLTFVGGGSMARVYMVSEKWAKQYFPDLVIRFGERKFAIKETSFAAINGSRMPVDADVQDICTQFRMVPPKQPMQNIHQLMNLVSDGYVSPLHASAGPFVDARIHAVTTAAALQDGCGYGTVRLFDHWFSSGMGTTRLWPWTKGPSPYKNVYSSKEKDRVPNWVALLLDKQSLTDGRMIWTLLLAAELSIRHNKNSKLVLPADPTRAKACINKYMTNVWKDDRVASLRPIFESLVDTHIIELQKSFMDSIVYSVMEFGHPLDKVFHEMEESVARGQHLTLDDLRGASVWIVETLINLVRLQSRRIVHNDLKTGNLILVENKKLKDYDFVEHVIPSAVHKGEFFSIYLPCIMYRDKYVQCKIVDFDRATSDLHGVGSPRKMDMWYDQLYLAASFVDYTPLARSVMPHACHSVSFFVEQYEEQYRRLHPRKKTTQDTKSCSEEESEKEEEEEDDAENTVPEEGAKTEEETEEEEEEEKVPDTTHGKLDFPDMARLISALGGYWWFLDANGVVQQFTQSIQKSKNKEQPIYYESLSPALLLQRSELIQTRWGKAPPAGSRVLTLGRIPSGDHPIVPDSYTESLANVWDRHKAAALE